MPKNVSSEFPKVVFLNRGPEGRFSGTAHLDSEHPKGPLLVIQYGGQLIALGSEAAGELATFAAQWFLTPQQKSELASQQ